MTGYTVENFNRLLPYFTEAHQEYLSEYHMNGKRRSGYRRYVMYKNSPLPCIEERLAFILSCLKLNPLQEHHADLFGIEQKQCYEFVHGLKVILDKASESSGCVPAQNDGELQEVLSRFDKEEDKVLLHNGAEREIPRPQDEEEQKDTSYQGYRPEGVKIVRPKKKPRGKELTKEEKENNRAISTDRVRVEHAIGSIKRCRIVKDECRLRKNNFTAGIFALCAALHNFRLKATPFCYKNKLT